MFKDEVFMFISFDAYAAQNRNVSSNKHLIWLNTVAAFVDTTEMLQTENGQRLRVYVQSVCVMLIKIKIKVSC